MPQPTIRPEIIRRASHREATPTAAQWLCCVNAAAIDPVAWQQGLYQLAYRQAVESVHADQFRHAEPNWN